MVVELLYCLLTRGYLQSRSGLVYGPFNLVYGFGALALTVGLSWLSRRGNLWIFIGGFAIGSVVEYICSWTQETMFHSVSWDYSAQPLNLNGRISLLYSCFWGVLALVWIKWMYPFLSRLIEKIPNRPGIVLTWILFVFMLFNTVVSALAVNRMNERRDGIPATTALQQILDERFPDERLRKIYANMVFQDDEQQGESESAQTGGDSSAPDGAQTGETTAAPQDSARESVPAG